MTKMVIVKLIIAIVLAVITAYYGIITVIEAGKQGYSAGYVFGAVIIPVLMTLLSYRFYREYRNAA